MSVDGEYSSSSEADQAYWNYVGESGGGGGDDGPGGGSSGAFSGSLTGPSTVGQGEAFDLEASVRNTTGGDVTATFMVLANDGGDWVAISGRERQTVSAGGSMELTLSVEQGMFSPSPGQYTLYLYATSQENDEAVGTVASHGVEVAEGPGAGEDGSEWETELLSELGRGFGLFRQTHTTEDRTRFFVMGENQSGNYIFVHPGGVAKENDPHYFDSSEEAIAAFRKLIQRIENGDADESERSVRRPGSQEAHRATAGSGSRFNRRQKLMLAVFAAVVASYVYYRKTGQWPHERAMQEVNL